MLMKVWKSFKFRMNEFLEQLVRVLTNAYSRSQKKFGERVSPGPANQRSFLCLPCCWGTNAIKRLLLIQLDCLCSVSFPISVFFTHSPLVVLRKEQTTISKRRGLKPMSEQWHQRLTSEPKSSLILTGGLLLWPFCLSVKEGFPGFDVRPSA